MGSSIRRQKVAQIIHLPHGYALHPQDRICSLHMKEEIRHRELEHVMLRRHVEHLILELEIDGIVPGVRLVDGFAVHLFEQINRVLAALDELLDGGLIVFEGGAVLARQPVDELLARVAGDLDLEGERLHVLV